MGNCCDNCSLQCIEFSLLIKNTINLLLTIISMIIINWDHAGYKGLVLYIFILILLIANEIFIILIICWRKKKIKSKINYKSNKFRIYRISLLNMFINYCLYY